MKKLGVVLVAILGVVLYLHHAVVHEVCVDAAIGLASLAGLCLAAAGVVHLAARGRAVQPARVRAAGHPSFAHPATRPRAARPGDPCAEACGRPATRMFGRWPVCEDCGGRLDAAAAHEAGRPDYPSKTAGLAAAYGHQPDDDLPALTQPPVVLNGESIGKFDITAFEEAHRND